jgi:3-methyladenine DNA glycosylase AlkD
MNRLKELRSELKLASSPDKAISSARFFKTNPGEYGEGDEFIGVTVPEQHKIAKRYKDLSLVDLDVLITSKVHEERLTAIFILVLQYSSGDNAKKEAIYNFYLLHLEDINNWDLVDSSAEYIVGGWLMNKDKTMLTRLAKSKTIWERRIAMLSTFHFIKNGDPSDALNIAELLIHDNHDLIQKAVGWMLREIGKRCSQEIEEKFLAKRYKTMPRTTLRYAIERFPEKLRRQYLEGSI